MNKKLIILLVLILVSVASLFASEAFDKANYTLNLKGVTSESLATIEKLSSQLTTTEKMLLEQKYSTSAVGPFFLNFLIGFGSGAFLQGDYPAAYIQLGLDLTGSLIILLNYVIGDMITGRGSSNTAYIIGASIFTASRIYQMVTPWTTAKKYNNQLMNSLYNSNNNTIVSIIPVVNNNNFGLIANISL